MRGLTVDDILLSISKLHNNTSYTEYEYRDVSYPVISEHGFKFAVLPSGTTMWKAMAINETINDHLTKCVYSYPSFYTSHEAAEEYRKAYYHGDGKVFTLQTVRPVKLLILNDLNNLIALAQLFKRTQGVRGFLRSSRKSAIKELLMVTGLGVNCLEQNEFKRAVESKLGSVYSDYTLSKELCESINDEKLKRLSLYAIDVQFAKNFCRAMRQYGCDGYIASEIPTAFGEIAPIFHSEVMICLTCKVLKGVQ